MKSRTHEDIWKRSNIALKIIWSFFALAVAADAESGVFQTLIAFIAFSSAAWVHSGIKWVLGQKELPLWSLFIFIVIFITTLYFAIDTECYGCRTSDYLPIFILGPIGFYFFRFVDNRTQGQNTIFSDFLYLKGALVRSCQIISGNKRNAFYIVLIISLLGMATNNFHDFSSSGFDQELVGLRLDSIYGTPEEKGLALKQIEKRVAYLADEEAKKTYQIYTIGFSIIWGLILVFITAPLWRWRVYHATQCRISWDKALYIQGWANTLTALGALIAYQLLVPYWAEKNFISNVIFSYSLISWVLSTVSLTKQEIDGQCWVGLFRAALFCILILFFWGVMVGLMLGVLFKMVGH